MVPNVGSYKAVGKWFGHFDDCDHVRNIVIGCNPITITIHFNGNDGHVGIITFVRRAIDVLTNTDV